MSITLLQGDCRTILATLPEQSVQCVVTSPPYYGLRRYDVEGAQIGVEQNPAEYIAALVDVFRKIKRVLRDDGVLWVNLGDSYTRNGGTQGGGNRELMHLEGIQQRMTKIPEGAPPEKNLLGIPWRVAFALQDDGWILRSDIIWHKPNPMPESVTDRPTRSHEYLFLFAKSARYYYDATAIAEQVSENTHGGNEPNQHKRWSIGMASQKTTLGATQSTTRNRRTVWTVATRPYSGAHFAVFPEQLIEPCILAGSAAQACEHCGAPWERVVEKTGYPDPEYTADDQGRMKASGDIATDTQRRKVLSGARHAEFKRQNPDRCVGFRPTCACPGNTGAARSVVLDPFVGSGTTCRVAERFGRNSIGIDLGYQDLQEQRTDGIQREMVELL